EEVAVSVHELDRQLAGCFPEHRDRGPRGLERCGGGLGGGDGDAVIAHPVLEEVAQDVEGIGPRRHLPQQAAELRDDLRPRVVEVQVGDEEGPLQTRSAFSITTGSTGTSWCPPALPVRTLRILST